MLSAEERAVIARAKHGGPGSRRTTQAQRSTLDTFETQPAPSYPAGCSTKTLGLLGKVHALLHAEPQPPKWALLKVLALLEEDRANEAR